eukprot:jgi/Hompol1/3898/HPOL_001659-RA
MGPVFGPPSVGVSAVAAGSPLLPMAPVGLAFESPSLSAFPESILQQHQQSATPVSGMLPASAIRVQPHFTMDSALNSLSLGPAMFAGGAPESIFFGRLSSHPSPQPATTTAIGPSSVLSTHPSTLDHSRSHSIWKQHDNSIAIIEQQLSLLEQQLKSHLSEQSSLPAPQLPADISSAADSNKDMLASTPSCLPSTLTFDIPRKAAYPDSEAETQTETETVLSSAVASRHASNREDILASSILKEEFHCSTCGRGFLKMHLLRSHMVVHSDTRPHKCSYCKSSFARRHDMLRHQRTIHGPKRFFNCKLCPIRFNMLVKFEKHVRASHSESADLDITSLYDISTEQPEVEEQSDEDEEPAQTVEPDLIKQENPEDTSDYTGPGTFAKTARVFTFIIIAALFDIVTSLCS